MRTGENHTKENLAYIRSHEIKERYDLNTGKHKMYLKKWR